MKKVLLFACLFHFSSQALAQFGANFSYRSINAPAWEDNIDRISSTNGEIQVPLDRGWGVGIDYWFRLKNKRVEFLPELNYSAFSKNWSNSEGVTGKLQSRFLSLYFNTNLYIFDLAGDCDCPTFSKDGDIMKKGFFIQISPGISFLQNQYQDLVASNTQDDNALVPSIGIGAGLDIGLSDFLTITPIVSYRYHFGAEWTNFHTYFGDQPLVAADNTTNIGMFSLGFRLGIRADE
ncbi:MAG: hypothetical protein AAF985_10635 [Bacteroidota bacterium]